MTPQQADQLLRTHDGLPVVGLLTNPNGGPDGTGAYISMVDKPSTQIDFRICRAVEPGTPKPEPKWWETLADWRNWPVIGSLVARASGDDFNAEWAAGELNNVMWRGFDILTTIFYRTLHDPLVTDKRAVIANAFNQFRDRVLTMLPGDGTTAEQYVEVARAAEAQISVVVRAGKMISAKNMGELTEIMSALRMLQQRLGALIEAGGGDPEDAKTSRAAPPQAQEVSVDPKTIRELATQAGELAVQTARSLNPSIAPAELMRLSVEAQDRVFRAAIQGTQQPAVPSNVLESQIAQFGALGAMRDPTAMAQSALTGELVARSIKAELAPLQAQIKEALDLARQHDVALFGGKVARRAADGTITEVEVRGALRPATPSGQGLPEPVKRGAENGGAPVTDPFLVQQLVNSGGAPPQS